METLTIVLAGLAIITYGISFVKGILNVRKSVDEPNQEQDLKIALMQEDLHDIRKNHLDHIERDVKDLIKGQARIEGILLNK